MKKLFTAFLLCFYFVSAAFAQSTAPYLYVDVNGAHTVPNAATTLQGFPVPAGGRLGLVSGNSTIDGSSSGNATVYYTPYASSVVNIPGSLGNQYFSEASASVGASASNTAYTFYLTSASSTAVTLNQSAWSGINTPPTTYAYQGQLFLDQAHTQLIVGGYYCASSGLVYRNAASGRIHLSNITNCIPHICSAFVNSTTSMSSTADTAAYGTVDGAGRMSVFTFLPEASRAYVETQGSINAVSNWSVGIGFNSTSSSFTLNTISLTPSSGYGNGAVNQIFTPTTAGYNFYQSLFTNSSGTLTLGGVNMFCEAQD